jgi:DNA-binding HxlR family transcriptional regulator
VETKLWLRYVRNTAIAVVVLFQSKWRVQILCALRSGPVRLGQLARLISGASKKMLTQKLRQLEADGIIVRKDMSDLVLHIEYDLAGETRQSVCALLDHLADLVNLHLEKPRIDEEPTNGRIAVIDGSPTAQIRSAQARRGGRDVAGNGSGNARSGKDGHKRTELAGRQSSA